MSNTITKLKTIEQMCAALYYDPEIAQAVLADARRLGNVDAIEAGTLGLPGETDAFHWHRRMTNQATVDEEQYRALSRIRELEKAVAALSAALATPQEGYEESLRQVHAQIGGTK